jgi:tRNA pseudouridine38-40 synthase
LPTWRLTIEYEGTRYHGWQEQKNARTIAGVLRKAAEDFLGTSVELGGSGRTDAGVHALAQVAHLRAAKAVRHTYKVPPAQLQHALNERLPHDVNVLEVAEARAGFDARRDALSRYYLYQISTRRTAFAKHFVWWVKDRLDFDSMSAATQSLVGLHDFAAFCEKRAAERSTLVTVERAEIGMEGDLLLFRIGASHFLWKMVRRIVGMLVEVGRNRVSVEEFKGLLLAPGANPKSLSEIRSSVAAHTAPPSGLFLERVVYAESDKPGALVAALPVRKML